MGWPPPAGARSSWINLNKRLSPKTSPIPSTHMHTGEYATPTPTAASPQSFGNDFNLIRAVEEYGPQRVESIRKELVQLTDRITLLTKEMHTLQRLVTVIKPNDQDMAWVTAEGHPDAYTKFTEARIWPLTVASASQIVPNDPPHGGSGCHFLR